MHFLDLPDDVLERVLSYITYDEVSRSRLVSLRFNEISKKVLNHGFLKVERYHTKCLKQVKAQLPRRESERRSHPLSRHCDILTAVETRMSLLSMTYKKYIDCNLCCFIPGKVLDEIYRVLLYVAAEQAPVRAHEVLQELRDLSSMAMEHFEEKVAPVLRKQSAPRLYIHSLRQLVKQSTSRSTHAKDNKISIMAQYMNKLTKRQNKLANEMIALRAFKAGQEGTRKRLNDLETFLEDAKKRLTAAEKCISEQQIIITNQTAQLKEQSLKIDKIKNIKEETESNSSKVKRIQHIVAVKKIKTVQCSLRSAKRAASEDRNKKGSGTAKRMKK